MDDEREERNEERYRWNATSVTAINRTCRRCGGRVGEEASIKSEVEDRERKKGAEGKSTQQLERDRRMDRSLHGSERLRCYTNDEGEKEGERAN